jgi:hypothetical protein
MQINVDGKKIFSTGKMTVGDDPVNFDIDITNAEIIELLVLDSGDNQAEDSAVWLEPVLYK